MRRKSEDDKPVMYTCGIGGYQYGKKIEDTLNVKYAIIFVGICLIINSKNIVVSQIDVVSVELFINCLICRYVRYVTSVNIFIHIKCFVSTKCLPTEKRLLTTKCLPYAKSLPITKTLGFTKYF